MSEPEGETDVEMPFNLKQSTQQKANRLWRRATYPVRPKDQPHDAWLLMLPYEIREMIFKYLYSDTCVVDVGLVRPGKDEFYLKLYKSDMAQSLAEKTNFLALYTTCIQLRRELLDFLLSNVILRPVDGVYFEHLSRSMRTDVPEHLRPRIQRARIEDGSVTPRLFRTARQDILTSLIPLGFTNLDELHVRDTFGASWLAHAGPYQNDGRDPRHEMSRWKMYRETIKEANQLGMDLIIHVRALFPTGLMELGGSMPIEIVITSGIDYHIVEAEGEGSPFPDHLPERLESGRQEVQPVSDEKRKHLEGLLNDWLQDRTELLNKPLQALQAAKIPPF